MASLKKTVQETLSINGLDVAIRGNGDENDYISLTDLAREKVGPEGDPRFAIGNWMRLKDTIALLGIWESSTTRILNVSNSTRLWVRPDATPSP